MPNSSPIKKRSRKPTSSAKWLKSLDDFATYLRNSQKSPHTIKQYLWNLNKFQEWWERETPGEFLAPASITDYDLREWQYKQRDEKLNSKGRVRMPASVNASMSALKSYLDWARRHNVISKMPLMPRPRRLAKRSVKWLDRTEQRRLLREASRDRDQRNPAIMEVLIETGLRVSELIALRWGIDVKINERKGTFMVRIGKGTKPRGPLPMTPNALQAFKTLRALDPTAKEGDPVFLSQRFDDPKSGHRKPLTVKGVQGLFSRYAKRLGWESFHPHQLRHTCAVNMRKGHGGRPPVDWPIIAVYLGHSTVQTTLDHYATPSAHDIENAVDPSGGEDID